MGMAMELITGFVTAPGAAITAVTLAAGNTLSIRNAPFGSNRYERLAIFPPGSLIPKEPTRIHTPLSRARPATSGKPACLSSMGVLARLRSALGAPGAVHTVVKRGYRLAIDPATC